ncbi:hypothetical protein Bca4012_035897 [Brassica carinata]
MRATAEHATAKIAVWWDMKDCPIPEGYDAGRIRQSLEGAFKEKGYSGPVSITAYGDQTQTPDHILQGLFSTGISIAHTRSESTNYLMYRDMVEWRDQNPPPATMMIISNQVGSQFSWDLVRLQQRTLYNLFLAYSIMPEALIVLSRSEEWCWKELLKNKRSAPPEDVNPTYKKVVRVTEDWGRNYKATLEFATAKIQVWWDMFDCPIPEGYDALQVRPSIEAAFKELGYYGPVSITAYGDHKHTPLQALSSTGVDVAHTVPGVEYKAMYRDVNQWHDDNPPQTAAIMMIISDNVEIISIGLVSLLQENKYNFFLAYSFRPYKMSYLLTSAEWLWESLLAGPLKKHSLVQKCSERESILLLETKSFTTEKFRARDRPPLAKESTRRFIAREIYEKAEFEKPAFRNLMSSNRTIYK